MYTADKRYQNIKIRKIMLQ